MMKVTNTMMTAAIRMAVIVGVMGMFLPMVNLRQTIPVEWNRDLPDCLPSHYNTVVDLQTEKCPAEPNLWGIS